MVTETVDSYSQLDLLRAFQMHEIFQNFKARGFTMSFTNFKINFNYQPPKPIELESNTFIMESEEFKPKTTFEDSEDCDVCGGNGYIRINHWEKEDCSECCYSGDKYMLFSQNNIEYKIRSYYKPLISLLNKFEINTEVYHIPSNRYFVVFVGADGKVNPFCAINDYSESNYIKPEKCPR